MSSRLLAVTFDSVEPERAAGFWAALLHRDVVPDGSGLLLPGDDTQVGLRFERAPSTAPPRLHLHLTSTTSDDQAATVERAIAMGGRRVAREDVAPDEFVVLADTDGHEHCVIGPGNRFLAGTGRLGEVTCEGSRAVGLFWHEALGWPLVWDDDGETAVQSPAGGTKVSWGGPPVAAKVGRNAQRFELVTDDVAAETQRLVRLGATPLVGGELADPDGNELRLRD